MILAPMSERIAPKTAWAAKLMPQRSVRVPMARGARGEEGRADAAFTPEAGDEEGEGTRPTAPARMTAKPLEVIAAGAPRRPRRRASTSMMLPRSKSSASPRG